MADDIAVLLRQLGLEQADSFGYSMGGGVALQLGVRHPRLVRMLVVAAATYNSAGMYPDVLALIATISPAMFAGSPRDAEYLRLAPHPQDFPRLVAKLTELDTELQDWSFDDMRAITELTLLIIGDADAVRSEHAVELFRLLGAVLPATSPAGPSRDWPCSPARSTLVWWSRPTCCWQSFRHFWPSRYQRPRKLMHQALA